MPDQDPTSTEGGAAVDTPPRRSSRSSARPLSPAELGAWLSQQSPAIVDRWMEELRSRGEERDPEEEELLERFLELLVSFLPLGIGPWRDQVEPLFREAAELYGSLGAIRGLAAGEAVEEMQLLREAVLRFLFRNPPAPTGGGGVGFREMLRLNRLVDLAVTHASVGHTDALFFDLLHGTGVADRPRAQAVDEIAAQLRHLAGERDRLFASAGAAAGAPAGA
jgi:hypothetical protein